MYISLIDVVILQGQRVMAYPPQSDDFRDAPVRRLNIRWFIAAFILAAVVLLTIAFSAIRPVIG